MSRLPRPPRVPAEAHECCATVPPPSKRKCSCGWTLAIDELCVDCDAVVRCVSCDARVFYAGHTYCAWCRGSRIPERMWREWNRALAATSDESDAQTYRDFVRGY